MTTLTLTPAEALALTLPATEDLLRGWVGPGLYEGAPFVISGLLPAHVHPKYGQSVAIVEGFSTVAGWQSKLLHMEKTALPMRSPEVRSHIVRWAAEGERCAACAGGVSLAGPNGRVFLGNGDDGRCDDCHGTNWLRPPHDRFGWLKPEHLGGPSEWIACALIWGSVVRVAAGLGPIVAAVAWRHFPQDTLWHWGLWDSARKVPGPLANFSLRQDEPHDSEARAAMEARALSRGFAILDNLPTGPVIRFEVPDAG